ncbi:MAG: PspC domain-containing protein [Rubrivivax sp.]|jgi:phage shock protein C
MSLSEELARLQELRSQGALTEAEFAQAKARLLNGGAGDGTVIGAAQRLRRSRSDRWLGGVCGGLARVTGTEAWLWRLGTVALTLFAGGGLLIYLLLWIFVPLEGE